MPIHKRKNSAALFELIDLSSQRASKSGTPLKIPKWINTTAPAVSTSPLPHASSASIPALRAAAPRPGLSTPSVLAGRRNLRMKAFTASVCALLLVIMAWGIIYFHNHNQSLKAHTFPGSDGLNLPSDNPPTRFYEPTQPATLPAPHARVYTAVEMQPRWDANLNYLRIFDLKSLESAESAALFFAGNGISTCVITASPTDYALIMVDGFAAADPQKKSAQEQTKAVCIRYAKIHHITHPLWEQSQWVRVTPKK